MRNQSDTNTGRQHLIDGVMIALRHWSPPVESIVVVNLQWLWVVLHWDTEGPLEGMRVQA